MLSPDFKEWLVLLNDNRVRYLVVGGYAVAYHGYPRYTKDLEIWIESTLENAAKIIQALGQFGFGSLGLKEKDFLESDTIIQLGHPPNRIDLITTIPGIDFATCYEEKQAVQIDDITVDFIDLENLKKSKKASSRPQDLADLENLE